MATSSPVIVCFPASPSKLSSAIPTPPGRRGASKMPSVVCAASSRARPTSQPFRIAASTPSCAPTTTPRENALTSKHRQRCSTNCCTSNVNPPPRFRGDDNNKETSGASQEPRGPHQRAPHVRRRRVVETQPLFRLLEAAADDVDEIVEIDLGVRIERVDVVHADEPRGHVVLVVAGALVLLHDVRFGPVVRPEIFHV